MKTKAHQFFFLPPHSVNLDSIELGLETNIFRYAFVHENIYARHRNTNIKLFCEKKSNDHDVRWENL